MRVLCIDAKNRSYSIVDVCNLLVEGRTYIARVGLGFNRDTQRDEPTYFLDGFHPRVGFSPDRFVVLPDEETKLVPQTETNDTGRS